LEDLSIVSSPPCIARDQNRLRGKEIAAGIVLFVVGCLFALLADRVSIDETAVVAEAMLAAPDGASVGPKVTTGRGIVLTVLLTSQGDPQRGYVWTPTFALLQNFWVSCVTNHMEAVIFHDGLEEEFIQALTNEYVRFEKVEIEKPYSTNDFRFLHYDAWLNLPENQATYQYVVFADVSDCFFLQNMFDYMRQRPQYAYFPSLGNGQFTTANWFKRWFMGCMRVNEHQLQERYNNTDVLNAGLWGAETWFARETLACMTRHFRGVAKDNILDKLDGRSRGNCNMAVYNACAAVMLQKYPALHDPTYKWINKFRDYAAVQKRYSNFVAIHNKNGQGECIALPNRTTVADYAKVRDELPPGAPMGPWKMSRAACFRKGAEKTNCTKTTCKYSNDDLIGLKDFVPTYQA
jgi:hypothetical protein